MKQRSLVAPVLLIGIGVAFLARNVVPNFPLLDYMARYWPFLLVLWGGLRLIELASWSLRGRPMPPYGLHGGEWMLVVILCFFGLSLHAVRGFNTSLPQFLADFGGWEIWGESYDYPESAEAETSAAPRIVLEQFRGTARIVGVEGTAVKVNGHRTVRSMDQATADRTSPDVSLAIRTDGERVTIMPSMRHNLLGKNQDLVNRGVTHDVDILVPRGAILIVKGRDSKIDIRNVDGTVEVNANDTQVRLENIGGEARVEVQGSDLVRAVNLRSSLELKGRGNDIDLENIAGAVTAGGSWSGLVQMRALAKPVRWTGLYTTMSMAAVPGEIRATTGDIRATRIMGPLRIESQNKDIVLSEVTGATTIVLQRGDIHFTATAATLADVSLRSEGGNVVLGLPENAKFNLNAVTERGEANNGIGGDIRHDDTRRGASLRRTAAGPAIDVHVTRGDIWLRTGAADTMLREFPERPRMPEMPEFPDRPRAPTPPGTLPEAVLQ
jgi:hypothetical protein